jgi:hypothetical protein
VLQNVSKSIANQDSRGKKEWQLFLGSIGTRLQNSSDRCLID